MMIEIIRIEVKPKIKIKLKPLNKQLHDDIHTDQTINQPIHVMMDQSSNDIRIGQLHNSRGGQSCTLFLTDLDDDSDLSDETCEQSLPHLLVDNGPVKPILKDKSLTFDPRSPVIEKPNRPKLMLKITHEQSPSPQITLSETPVPTQTSNVILQPFWKQKTSQLTSLFWSPTKLNCVNLKIPVPIHSWVSTLVQQRKHDETDHSPNLIKMLPKTPLNNDTYISRKIRIFPTVNDKIKLKNLFGASRYVYNHGIDVITSNREKYLAGETENETLLNKMRRQIVKNDNYQGDQLRWMLSDLPSDARDSIVRELNTNYFNGIKTGRHFELKKRNKKQSQSMTIRLRDYNRTKGSYSFLKKMKKAELFPESVHDLKLLMDVDGHYYVIIPYKLETHHPLPKFPRKPKKIKLTLKHEKIDNGCQPEMNPPHEVGDESQVPQPTERSLSGDLGVRTFLTGYTPDGSVYHIGLNDIQLLYRLFYYKNKLQGRITKSTGKRKRRMRKAWICLSKRIHNLVDDFHKKTVKWLLENYSTIIIPKLDVNQFNAKKTSRITINKMKLWRHCSFIRRLNDKRRFYPESNVINPTEEYTSKTCSHCGGQHPTLGANKTFLCPNPQCQRIFDRDVNASYNILLKTLTETTEVVL